MVAVLTHSVLKLVFFVIGDIPDRKAVAFNWSIQLFIIVVVLFHAPIVVL